MDNILRQSTAATIVMGVMVDSTDGNTPETTLSIAQADIRLSKNGGGYAQSNNIAGATHMETGKYSVPLDTTDTATLGKLRIDIHKTGALAVWREFTVVTANAYDTLVLGTDVLQADVTQLAGVAQSLTDLKDFVDICYDPSAKTVMADIQQIIGLGSPAAYLKDLVDAGYDHLTHKVQGVVLADTVTALTGHTAQTGDSFARLGAPTGASIAADLVVIDNFVDELESRLSAIRAGYLDNLSAGAVALDSGVDITKIHGVALTETVDGYLAAAFTKLFDVVTPLLVASDIMRGTDSAAPAATALTDVIWTDAKAAFLDHSIATVDGNVDAILLDTGTNGVVVATASKTGYALTATGANLILKDSIFALAIADAMCDEALTGAEHNIPTSLGRRIREIGAYAIHSGTAQAGDSVHITLAAAASAADGLYNRNLLVLTDGTGADQTRTIIDYKGATRVATIDREWRINPDATTEYQIVADDTPLVVDQGVAQAGSTSSTIKLREYASSTNDIYLCNIVIIVAGTGRGQARLVNAYDGATKVVTICGDNWITTPDDTSVYVMIPYGATCVACVGTDALAQINTECDTALADYDGPTRAEATTDKNAIITEVDANETKIDTLQTDSTAIKAKTDNLPSGIAKNVALPKLDIFMVLSSDHVTSATGKTITSEISKDGGSFTGITNAITEVGSGVYVIADGLTQTEMNADIVTLKFTETDCDQRTITIHTT